MEINWKDYASKFDLQLDENAEKDILSLINVYKLSSENEAFFYYIKNTIGSELGSIGDDWTDLFAWLKIVKKGHFDWFMYDFEEYDDYLLWKEMRIEIFGKVSSKGIRLINLFELNCVNIIGESTYIKNNDLKEYYIAESSYEKIIFVTNGKIMKFIEDRYSEYESMDFISFYKLMFQKGYKMIPLGQSVPEYIK
jgi:hypothetical protein